MQATELTYQTLRVARLFVLKSPAPISGTAMLKSLRNIKRSTLYDILTRLERERWLVSEWERVDPAMASRPARRLYRLTETGALEAGAAFRALHVPVGKRKGPGR